MAPWYAEDLVLELSKGLRCVFFVLKCVKAEYSNWILVPLLTRYLRIPLRSYRRTLQSSKTSSVKADSQSQELAKNYPFLKFKINNKFF
jgi:hypothetical protein